MAVNLNVAPSVTMVAIGVSLIVWGILIVMVVMVTNASLIAETVDLKATLEFLQEPRLVVEVSKAACHPLSTRQCLEDTHAPNRGYVGQDPWGIHVGRKGYILLQTRKVVFLTGV